MIKPILRKRTNGAFDAVEVDTQTRVEYALVTHVSMAVALDTILDRYAPLKQAGRAL